MIKLDENKNLFLSVKIKNRNQTTDLNKIYLSKFYSKLFVKKLKTLFLFILIFKSIYLSKNYLKFTKIIVS